MYHYNAISFLFSWLFKDSAMHMILTQRISLALGIRQSLCTEVLLSFSGCHSPFTQVSPPSSGARHPEAFQGVCIAYR
jgi:hypothetical protein